MANGVLNRITEAIRAAALRGAAGPPDAELLDRFRRDRDGEAFAALVRRHGRTVLAACRRVLANPADVDDAFQATFLVLARKIDAIEGATVGSWLYAVAHRLAVRARSDARRRAEREGAAARQRAEVVPPEPSWRDAVAVLHEELDRLPDAYRQVLLLCYLRGLSREEAAAELGWSPGAVKGQLERGRKMLAARLTRRGIGLSAGLLAVVTGNSAGAGGPPPGLVDLTVWVAAGASPRAVVALTRGVIRSMIISKTRVVLGVGVVLATCGLMVASGRFWPAPPTPTPTPGLPDPAATRPAAALEGRWRCVGREADGKPMARWLINGGRVGLTITGNMIAKSSLLDVEATFSVPATPANAIDIRVRSPEGQEGVLRGLAVVEGDTLRLAFAFEPERPRPTGFATRAGDAHVVHVFRRVRSGEVVPEAAADRVAGVISEASRVRQLAPERVAALSARCLKLAEDNPDTDEAAVSLLWVLANAPAGEARNAALAGLRNGGIAGAGIETLAICFGLQRGTIGPGDIPDRLNQGLAPLLLERVRRTPDHPKAAEVLSSVCSLSRGDDGPEVSPVFDGAARMIADRWTESPDLTHFLETLSAVRQRPWAARYEPAVRAILARTPNAYIRHRAAFTLARLVAETGEARQEEARELYVQFVKSYKPGVVDPSWEGVTEELVKQARREVDAMLVRGIGGPAPALEGVDLDGKPIALGDYRGKVVLLSFWATWCGPCMRLIPYERALAERFKGRPFAVVGVNGDEVEKLDRKLIETHKVTWRSFRNKLPGRKAIGSEWNVIAWPTLYLIDHTGTIRRRWSGTPPPDEFDHEVARWVAAAEGKPLAPALRPRAEAMPPAAIKGVPAKFIDKVHADGKGGAVKYVVCVPDGHDGKTPLPVVLFLHGSGQVGTDNKKQLEIGFGPAVRKGGMPFPFVGVFPQAGDGPWLAESPDGKGALAILKAVEREYATDPRRVYLTGVSMGGEGTWSLAAAHPKRFAAIVPVCGGGNPKHASALKDVPCWAFHGDSDRTVPVGATRDTVRAITVAGGRPLYQEYRGVDHNCWDQVYAEAEMYRWLRAQVLK